jgi:hypothetical protein
MSLTLAQLQKATGLELNASTTDEQVFARIAQNIVKGTGLEIGTALLINDLINVRGWQINEAAPHLNMSDDDAALIGRKGQVLFITGEPNLFVAQWAQMKPLGRTELTALVETLVNTPDAEKATVVQHRSLTKVMQRRMGESTKPEQIETMVEEAIELGATTPRAARALIPAIAEKLSIELPKPKKRSKSAETAADNKADIPTFDQALTVMFAAIEQLNDGCDEDYPLTVTTAQRERIESLISNLTDICVMALDYEPLAGTDRPDEVTEFAADSEEYTRTA